MLTICQTLQEARDTLMSHSWPIPQKILIEQIEKIIQTVFSLLDTRLKTETNEKAEKLGMTEDQAHDSTHGDCWLYRNLFQSIFPISLVKSYFEPSSLSSDLSVFANCSSQLLGSLPCRLPSTLIMLTHTKFKPNNNDHSPSIFYGSEIVNDFTLFHSILTL